MNSILEKIEKNIHQNARKLDIVKWEYLFERATKNDIEHELIKYQNDDGGFGSGLEIDTLTPESSSLCSEEAILLAFEYGLDGRHLWMKKLLDFFERTKKETPSYWELVPVSISDYPHPEYLKYIPDTHFTPQVSAVVAMAMIKYGNTGQKELGFQIAKKCIDFLNSNAEFWFFETQFVIKLYQLLCQIGSDLINEQSFFSMKRRIDETMCTNKESWRKFVAQPLDLIDTPSIPWYSFYVGEIAENLSYWMDTLDHEGKWPYYLSWSTQSPELQQISLHWAQFYAVKRIKTLMNYNQMSALK